MALTTVRARLGDTWVTLTYNEATGRYEGTLTPQATSIHQPGGYYSVEVEAANDTGETASITGEQLPSLRLVVRETAAPTLTLASPAPGYLTTATPTFAFEAVDEAGGSGVDPESFAVDQAGTAAHEAISGGYRFTWSPPGGWADGAHTVTASVSDYDGNEATVSGSYTVDTVPPVLLLRQPYMRHVVDDESVTVAGEVWDVTSPAVAVTVAGEAVPVADGRFEVAVDLAIGENHIAVTATDGAGNQTTAEVYLIRLVTDRTEADRDKIRDLCSRGYDSWTAEERAWWASALCFRGSYDERDLNRVGIAVGWLAGELRRRGYLAPAYPKMDWVEADAPTRSQMAAYLAGVEAVRVAQGIYLTEIPLTMDDLSLEGANNIERALVEADAVFPHYSAWTAGEISCGGV